MPGIVYLHGFGSGPDSTKGRFFAKQFEEIGVDVALPDLNPPEFRDITITGQLQVADRVIHDTKPDLVIGSSMGGYLAALHAATHPETVPALVLLAPAFAFARRWSELLGPEQMADWKRTGEHRVYHHGTMEHEPVGYGLYLDATDYPDFPEVTQPTRVFHGKKDITVDAQLSVEFAWGKPNAQVELVESGHELTDIMDLLWAEVARFYQELTA